MDKMIRAMAIQVATTVLRIGIPKSINKTFGVNRFQLLNFSFPNFIVFYADEQPYPAHNDECDQAAKAPSRKPVKNARNRIATEIIILMIDWSLVWENHTLCVF